MSQYTSLSPANEKAWHWHQLYQGWLSLAEAHRKGNRMQFKPPFPLNRAGIPVHEINTLRVPASFWAGDFKFTPTTHSVKFVKNR